MVDLLFDTASIPLRSPKPDSQTGIARITELGLDCLELAWVRRVSMARSH
jgi:hypothetical protein